MKKNRTTYFENKNEAKRAFSPKSTKDFIDHLEQVIKDKHTRKEAISIIKALDGKKIRNTSGV